MFQEKNYFDKKGSSRFDFIDKIHHLCLTITLSEIQELNKDIADAPEQGQQAVEKHVSAVLCEDMEVWR